MTFITDILSENVISAIGWTLIHSIWQGALLALVLAVALVLMKSFSSESRYVLASAFLLLVLLVSAGTFISVYKGGESSGEIGITPALVDSTSMESTTPVSEELFEQAQIPETDEAVATSFFAGFPEYFEKNFPLIVSIWFLGLLILTLRFIGAFAYSQRLKTYKTSPVPDEMKKMLENLKDKMSISRPVKFVESAIAGIPMVIGHFKPVLLVPLGMLTKLPRDQVEAVLAHEMAHIIRKDYFVNILQSIVDILFFYHPGIRWISTQIRNERENCCDDIALKVTGDSVKFARALTSLQHAEPVVKTLPVAALFSRAKSLLNRVTRLMDKPKVDSTFGEGFIAAFTVAIMAVLMFTFIGVSSDITAGTDLTFSTSGEPFEGTIQTDQVFYSDGNNIYKQAAYFKLDKPHYVKLSGSVQSSFYNKNTLYLMIYCDDTGSIIDASFPSDFLPDKDRHNFSIVKELPKNKGYRFLVLHDKRVKLQGITLLNNSKSHDTFRDDVIKINLPKLADISVSKYMKDDTDLGAYGSTEIIDEDKLILNEKELEKQYKASLVEKDKKLSEIQAKAKAEEKELLKQYQVLKAEQAKKDAEIQRQAKAEEKELEKQILALKAEQETQDAEMQLQAQKDENELEKQYLALKAEEEKRNTEMQRRAQAEEKELQKQYSALKAEEKKQIAELERKYREEEKLETSKQKEETERSRACIEVKKKEQIEALEHQRKRVAKVESVEKVERLRSEGEKIEEVDRVEDVEDLEEVEEVEEVEGVEGVEGEDVEEVEPISDEEVTVYKDVINSLPDKFRNSPNYFMFRLDKYSTTTYVSSDELDQTKLNELRDTITKLLKKHGLYGSEKGSMLTVAFDDGDNIFLDIKTDKITDEKTKQKLLDELRDIIADILE